MAAGSVATVLYTMTPRCSLFVLPLLAAGLSAQANVVPGLDGRLTVVDDLTYYGRRGAAFPNGEVGMAMLNEMCNPGSVVIPWQAAMQPNHPKFGFLIVREAHGRMEQISDGSFCKHAFVSTNYSGPCGACVDPGTGSVMGLNCADTYGAGNNADRFWLGPPSEIDPWLGTWNPVGSYFDQGDPNVGPPANNDGVRSPGYSGSDPVRHRVTVRESDLLVPGARYFYGIHLIHQGESVANRGDNLASRGFTPTGSPSGWSFANNAVGQVWGSILQHWNGATLNSGGNGNDDGRFFVAVVVTPLGGGQYHYEYAVHNVDNSRGGATFRVPVASTATVANFTFRDIDGNPLNDWLASRSANEVVWTAPGTNPLNWNTIYNFGFDCNVAPGGGAVVLDAARLGAGAPSVAVLSNVPGGVPVAQTTSIGAPCATCASSFHEYFSAPAFDLHGRSMTLTLQNGSYQVGAGTASYVAPTGVGLPMSDDVEVSVNLPFSLPYPGGVTNVLRVCSNGFLSPGASNGIEYEPSVAALLAGAPRWAALWHDLVPDNFTARVYYDSSPVRAMVTWLNVPNFGGGGLNTFQVQFLPNGTVHILWQNVPAAGNPFLVGWSRGGNARDPGPTDLSVALASGFGLCATDFGGLRLQASARPVLGGTVDLTTSNIPSGSPFLATVLSSVQLVPPVDLAGIGSPGCLRHVQFDAVHLRLGPGSSAVQPFAVPNSTALNGTYVTAQSFSYSPPLTPGGLIAANAVGLLVGQI
ncbi:MAG: hypothetical protein JNK49_17220 [Planctomycetes bacterium]|nr:hypothetical protein [Planctomycetota bacterium]